MFKQRVTPFRRLRPVTEGSTWWQRMQQRSGTVLLVIAGIATASMLVVVPLMYAFYQIERTGQTFTDAHWADLEAVERQWKTLLHLGPFKSGDEPEVKEFLDKQPLVVALLDRFEARTLWERQGDRLVPAADTPQNQVYRGWIAHAEVAQRFEWNPAKDEDPDFAKIASVVLLSDRWMVVKRWKPGSAEVEKDLRLVLGPDTSVRIGLMRDTDTEDKNLQPQDWGKAPHLQADSHRIIHYTISSIAKTNAFGDGWDLGAIPSATEDNTYWYSLRKRLVLAFGLSLMVGVAIFLGFWLRNRARRRAILDADRLASLTHSLKTPLAILKFRCDSLRLGTLTQDQSDEELLKLGAEVDHLSLMIENGLRAIHGDDTTGPPGLVDGTWIREVAMDLQPGFEAEGRELDFNLGPEQGRASLPSLRSALLTLLENALTHGKGLVQIHTERQRRRMIIRVSDQGVGLEAHQVAALGKPFQRFRTEGREGFMREGQGLGLSLLTQVAEKEGWGLSFESAPGEGFTATLEILGA